MEIILDARYFEELGALPPWLGVWQLFIQGGWIIFLFVIVWGIWKIWITNKQIGFIQSIKYTLLAIDVPKENEQGPKAVEQIFAQLAGASRHLDFIQRNFKGMLPLFFSLEIISIEGYIQFLIRTPDNFRDLAESAIYAQYPDAEITEVEDYTEKAPKEFPSEEYDFWGTEFVFYNSQPYPIRTYPYFEDPMVKERFKDPMAATLEVLSKIGKGEQIWLQLLISSCGSDWKKEGDILVKKLIGAKVKAKLNLIDRIILLPLDFLGWFHEQIWGPYPPEKNKELISQMQFLSPGERKVVEAIQNKISKDCFKTKFRMVYLGEKEVFSKGRGVSAVIGAIKQFNTLDMNGFKPDSKTKTSVNYWRVKKRLAKRQKKLIRNYRTRSGYMGARKFVMNTEELATLFHFPVKTVKAPLLKKAEVKKAEPPVFLPTKKVQAVEKTLEAEKRNKEEIEEEIEEKIIPEVSPYPEAPPTPKGEPPTDLPVE